VGFCTYTEIILTEQGFAFCIFLSGNSMFVLMMGIFQES
jgi:hypothetical protein